jgi:diguanylate cyclase (GGDEF)-like protein
MHNLRVTTRFFAALVILLAALTAVGVLGVHGLREVRRANDQVFSDNFVTAEATNRLTSDLARAQAVALEITATSDVTSADRLRAQLHQAVLPQVAADLRRLRRLHADDPPSERRQIERIPVRWQAFVALTRRGVLALDRTTPDAAQRSSAAASVAATLDPLSAYVAARQAVEVEAAADAHAGAEDAYRRSLTWLLIAAAIAALAAIVMVQVGMTLKRLVDQRARDQLTSESASEYIDILQVTENEDEAQELLRRQTQRATNGGRAVVLSRNNSDDRLEAKTSLEQLPELRERLEGATPRACLAIRFGRSHAEDRDPTALVNCTICGALPGASRCEPLLVGGEIIGAVLTNVDGPAGPDRQLIRQTVAQSAPVLANLRNLAIAELRAATDALTGLPNQRAVQDTLKRMVAQAARTINPLAALLVDLDHFKQVNDLYGHDRGDEVLAAVGVALSNVVRESDFAGRYGGEEFLLLLPNTDHEGALHVAEAVRTAISAISVTSVDQPITASVGVAVLPHDAGDAVTLFRAADHALYAAKKNGRNRIESAASQFEDVANR